MPTGYIYVSCSGLCPESGNCENVSATCAEIYKPKTLVPDYKITKITCSASSACRASHKCPIVLAHLQNPS